ncbi:MAG: nucleoside deaminase [Rhodanobacteraceae bacterium]|jgi:tRNA(Arg) A34 adenosine deaminase TadA|nr:nucleoside deaminase [Rhodanobacteraceae bacterium]
MLTAELRLALPAWLDAEIDTEHRYADDAAKVALAIRLARRNIAERSGGPFGAAVFDGEGRVVAAGVNRVLPETCSVAHAEMMAFIAAQTRLRRHRLNGEGGRYVLATSAQPCCQCYGASVWAGIDELLIGARAEDVMELSEFDEGPLPADWIGELEKRGIAVRRDILREDAREVFRRYAQAGGARY